MARDGIQGHPVFVLSLTLSVAKKPFTIAITFELQEIETSYLTHILY